MTAKHSSWWFAISTLGVACACSGPPSDRVFVPEPPSEDGFSFVGNALSLHCGTLDCHGNASRNFRIYGIYGLRLKPNVVGTVGTTDAEYERTYESIVALQPEILSEIVAAHGADPERWIVITKGRGTEHHKGGSRMQPGDATDRCIVSWISGALDQAACTKSAELFPPTDGGF